VYCAWRENGDGNPVTGKVQRAIDMAYETEQTVRINSPGGYGGRGCASLPGHALDAGGQQGVLLIGMIVVLFLVSSLVVAMMSQSTSTAFSLAYENSSNRAYYLAESGFRYAAARIKHGADMKTGLHLRDPSFSLAKSAGSFDLSLFPHYLETTGSITGATLSGIDIPGGYDNGSADALAFPGGSVKKIRIVAPDGTWDDIHEYATATLTPTQDATTGKYTATVTFTGVNPSISKTLPSGTVILPVAEADGDQNNVGNDDGSGGTIALSVKTGSTQAFPKYNGNFYVEGQNTLYAYEEKIGDTLAGITTPLDATQPPPFSFADGDNLIAGRFVQVKSIGTFRNASRTLTYHTPMGTDIEKRFEFVETFADKSNWEDAAIGDHTIEEIDGGNALRVTGTGSLGGSPKASLIAFKPSADTIDLAAAYRYGNPNFLSYDAQVKIGFVDTDPDPDHGYEPAEPIPLYYVAGLNFRLDDDLNSYGLSFLRGSNSTSPTPDNIDDDLIPVDQTVMLVLWQQIDDGATPNWIAYKDMSSARNYFSDNVESGAGGWTATGLWHISTRRAYRGTYAWYYGRETDWDYDAGDNSGTLTSPEINLCHISNPELRFRSWYETEFSNIYDVKYVDIYDGEAWNNGVYQITRDHPMRSYDLITVDLSAYVDKTIQVRFRFDTIDNWFNDDEGWHIDNIRVRGAFDFPVIDSTLMVRVKEAASLKFRNGTVGISEGDVVTGATTGAFATVAEPPHIQSGSWGGGDARGTLLLRNRSGTFEDRIGQAEDLKVNGVTVGKVSVDTFYERSNFIRAYYGDATGCGTPDGDPFDDERSAHARGGTIHWPPDTVAGWAAGQDHFTLVQWDQLNPSVTSSELVRSGAEPDAVIRSDESVLLSPDTGIFGKPELGLHTFGKGSLNTYFDDFAVQSDIIPHSGYLPVIQQ
jgi:hypothetical protein